MYSDKPHHFSIRFPSEYKVFSSEELKSLQTGAREFYRSRLPETVGDGIFTDMVFLAHSDLDVQPVYSIAIMVFPMDESMKSLSLTDFVVTNINTARKDGANIPKFTKPVVYTTSSNVEFCTSAIQMLSGAKEYYTRCFVAKNATEFFLIVAKTPDTEKSEWLFKIVDSMKLLLP